MRTLCCFVVVLCFSLCLGLDNGLGRTPPLGWNSWNKFACHIHEDLIKKTADALVDSGLASVGYKYVNLDDCWQKSRDSNGYIQEDASAFPNGIKSLADYVHSKGLKFGVYSDAGYYTCQRRPGSIGHETKDAESYAKWGVDYLKYDNCYSGTTKPEVRYPPMRDALNATGRPIFFSMCEWGVNDPWTWAKNVGNSYRTTQDIQDNWKSVLHNLDANRAAVPYAGPGSWADPDMLEIGNGGLTVHEEQSHFSLWALVKSPLLIGCDVTNMSDETVSILSNTEVIAVNQDPLGAMGDLLSKDPNGGEIWGVPMQDGSYVMILFNRAETELSITGKFTTVGLPVNTKARLRDLWKHSDIGEFVDEYTTTVASHHVVVVRIYVL